MATNSKWQVESVFEMGGATDFPPKKRIVYVVARYPGEALNNYGLGYSTGTGEPRLLIGKDSKVKKEQKMIHSELLQGVDAREDREERLHPIWFEALLPNRAYHFVELREEKKIILKFFFDEDFDLFTLKGRGTGYEAEKILFSVSTEPAVIRLLSRAERSDPGADKDLDLEKSLKFLSQYEVDSETRLALINKFLSSQDQGRVGELVRKSKLLCSQQSDAFFSAPSELMKSPTLTGIKEAVSYELKMVDPSFVAAAHVLAALSDHPTFRDEILDFYMIDRSFHYLSSLNLLPKTLLNPDRERFNVNPMARFSQYNSSNPLQRAAAYGSLSFFRFVHSKWGESPTSILTMALSTGNIAVAEEIFSTEIKSQELSDENMERIIWSTGETIDSEVFALLERHIPNFVLTKYKLTRLMDMSANFHNIEGMRFLLAKFQPKELSAYSFIYSIGSVEEGRASAFRVMLENSDRFYEDPKTWKARALYNELYYLGNAEVIQALLDFEANPDFDIHSFETDFRYRYKNEIEEILRESKNEKFASLYSASLKGSYGEAHTSSEIALRQEELNAALLKRMNEVRTRLNANSAVDERLVLLRRMASQGDKYVNSFSWLMTRSSEKYFYQTLASEAKEAGDTELLEIATNKIAQTKK